MPPFVPNERPPDYNPVPHHVRSTLELETPSLVFEDRFIDRMTRFSLDEQYRDQLHRTNQVLQRQNSTMNQVVRRRQATVNTERQTQRNRERARVFPPVRPRPRRTRPPSV